MLFASLFFLTPKLLQKRRQIQTNPPLTVRNTTKTMHWEWPWVFSVHANSSSCHGLSASMNRAFCLPYFTTTETLRLQDCSALKLRTSNPQHTVSNLIYCRTLLLTLLKEVPGYLLWLLTPFIINPSALMKGIIVSIFTSVSPLGKWPEKLDMYEILWTSCSYLGY